MSNAFDTIKAARALRERHPDAAPSAVNVGLVMATFANGRSGTSIRPGHELIAEITGLHLDTVRDAIRWLKDRGELREDKAGHRGSAACYTWLGGMVGSDTPPLEGMVGSHTGNDGVSHPTHQPDHLLPSGPPGPRGGRPGEAGRRCRKHPANELGDGDCWECDYEAWKAVHGPVESA